MLRRASLLLLLLPGFALAQTGTVTAFATSQGVIGQANRADCTSATAVATWAIVTTGLTLATGDKWRLSTSSGSCSTTVPTTYLTEVLASSTTQSIPGVFVAQMATEASVSCIGANNQTINLCVYYLPTGTIPSNPLVFTGTLNFQTAIPPPPSVNSSSPGDGQLSINVTSGTATATETAVTGLTFTVTCTPPAGGSAKSATGNAGNIVCSGLTNGTPYTVTAVATSSAGNVGAVSAAFGPGDSTTPLPFVDFWTVYKSAGGVETGGCGAGGAGSLAPLLAVLGFLVARRRRS